MTADVVIPFGHAPGEAELAWLDRVASAPGVASVRVAADAARPEGLGNPRIHWFDGGPAGVRTAVTESVDRHVIVQRADPAYDPRDYLALLAPLEAGRADVVLGHRVGANRPVGPYWRSRTQQALGALVRMSTNLDLRDPATGVQAFEGGLLRALPLRGTSEGLSDELLVKAHAMAARFVEVPLLHSTSAAGSDGPTRLAEARRLLALLSSDESDGVHEGYGTLLRMEGAPSYNRWLGGKLRSHLGPRVLEVGAGIGTITREIEQGRELLVALEMEPLYVEKLKRHFHDRPHVRPVLSGVEAADWDRLAVEQFDSVVLSNVLEHIEDDVAALRNFHRVLRPGGNVVILVPALPALYGSIDEAVKHFRRYVPEQLESVIGQAGFKVDSIRWLNLLGIPGWWVNGRLLRRREVPRLQLALYDRLAPLLARLEDGFQVPIGMSLIAVATRQ